MTPFKMLDFDEYAAIEIAGQIKRLKDCNCKNGKYEVSLYKTDTEGREFMIFKYFEEGDEDAILPDHIWSKIFIGPSFGEGTQMLQHGLLSVPLCVVNGANEGSIYEVINDGIVAFEVNGDRELGKNLYLWMKNNTIEYVFQRLGEEIIDGYVSQLQGGDAKKLLINNPIA